MLGLYPKYKVTNRQTGEEATGVFVLKPESDLHARAAIAAYARSIERENPILADDLREWLNHLEPIISATTSEVEVATSNFQSNPAGQGWSDDDTALSILNGFDYDPDCASCLAHRPHSVTEHEDHLLRSLESSSADQHEDELYGEETEDYSDLVAGRDYYSRYGE